MTTRRRRNDEGLSRQLQPQAGDQLIALVGDAVSQLREKSPAREVLADLLAAAVEQPEEGALEAQLQLAVEELAAEAGEVGHARRLGEQRLGPEQK